MKKIHVNPQMKYAFYMMAASVGMLAACSGLEEMDFQEKTVSNDGSLVKQVIFEAPVIHSLGEDGETRASLSQEGDGAIHFLWEATDTVGVYPDKGSQVFFDLSDGAGTNVAKFDGGGWALRENSKYSCYFPFVCDMKLDRNSIPVSFADQEQKGTSNYEGVRFCLASEGTSSSTGSLQFHFQMLNSIIRIKAIGLPAGTYTKLSLKTDDALFVQKGTFGLDEMSIKGKTYSNALEVSLKDFTLTEASTEQNPALIYLTSAPVDLRGHKITITVFSEDGSTYQCVKTPSKVFAAGAWVGFKCVMESSSVKYAKASTITVGGSYLIVDADDARLFTGVKEGNFESISPENTIITDKDGSLAKYEFTVENNGNNYYLKFNDGKYLICNYNGNTSAGLAYVDSQSNVTYPYALTTGNNGAFFFSTTQVNKPSETNQVLYYKAGENIFKIGGSGRSIGVHLYLKDGKQDRGLRFNPQDVSCTLGENPEKPVLSGTYTTATYSSSNDKIAMVDINGNVTPVAIGSVTITATVAEDAQYSAGSASYTLRILKAPSDEWVDIGSFNLENKALCDYLNDASKSYTDTDDATNTVMSKYTGAAYNTVTRKDCPAPVTISWTNAASNSTVITIYEDQNLTKQAWSQNATASAKSAEVYNLIPGRTYYYTVSEGTTIWEKGYFNTTGRRRMIKVSENKGRGYANNCRDLGGLEVTDKGAKKTIKYGYLFRGTNMDRTTQAAEWPILLDFMNVGRDIDLRNGSASGSGYSNDGNQTRFRPLPQSIDYTAPGFMDSNNFPDLTTREKVYEVVMAFFNTVKSGKSVYFHCFSGADRTGYIAMLIEGLLGVSEKDCSIDYELTSFCDSVGGRYRTGLPTDYDFRDGIAFLRGQTGDTFQNKIENYLVNTVGISQADINEFKSLVLE